MQDPPKTEDTDQYLSWKEGASLLGVGRTAFYRLVQEHQVGLKEEGPRHRQYRASDLRLLKQQRAARGLKRRKRTQARQNWTPAEFSWLTEWDIPAILRLDQQVYHEMYLAEMETYRQWSAKNPFLAMAAFAPKSNRQVMLAYVALLPLDEEVIFAILRGEREEVDITTSEMQTYDRPGGYTLLANSAVCLPEHPDLLPRILLHLMDAWVERFPDRYITRIYTQVISQDGDRMAQHFFMAPLPSLAPNAYVLDLARTSASRVIRRFQERLRARAPLPVELQPPYERPPK